MKIKIFMALLFLFVEYSNLQAQQLDSLNNETITLNEVVVSANNITETKRTVAQQVQIINARQIAKAQAQNTADLLISTAGVSVQKSQMGGGSPVIRGFEASRIVLVVDGVRLNNLIYRSGHLQNILTLDNASLERLEVLYGPSSTVYGSDALGGVVHLYTRTPMLAEANSKLFKGNAFVRYGSVNNELSGHIDFNIGTAKMSSFTSFTYSKFGDLRGGASLNPFYKKPYGERPFYVERINDKDSLVTNDDKYLQVQSGYNQHDLVQKILFQPAYNVQHLINVQYSNSSDVPRYDRLTDPNGNGLRFAQWYYGPQTRLMAAYDFRIKHTSSWFDALHLLVNYQNVIESRHQRRFGRTALQHRTENVDIMGATLDFQRISGTHNIRYGVDFQHNLLKSTAFQENINTGEHTPLDTRYPDGNNRMTTTSAYLSHTWHISPSLTLNDGIRVGYSMLLANFTDTSFFKFPYTQATQNTPVYSGSAGLIFSPTATWKTSLMVATGYRVPNIDDLSKVFESAAGTIIVPNTDVKPEKTINTELGFTKIFGEKVLWENALFYTLFNDAIVADKFQYNGQDSILYDGSWSTVMANQNKRNAYLYGFSSNIKAYIGNLSLTSGVNYTYGRIRTDTTAAPLDHIPPFMARLQADYSYKKLGVQFSTLYSAWKHIEDYYPNGEDNEQYAAPEGMPAWITFNLRLSYQVHKTISLHAGVDNLLDTQYRTFASGINAPGRNLFFTIRARY